MIITLTQKELCELWAEAEIKRQEGKASYALFVNYYFSYSSSASIILTKFSLLPERRIYYHDCWAKHISNTLRMYIDKSLKTELKAKGYRKTPQREIIWQVFQNLPIGTHLSVEELHQLLVERGEGMSLSTVYRNLKIMRHIGFLREVELVPAHKHYELNTDSKYHHHHIVCVQCNQAIEFINQSIIQQGRRQVQKAGLELLDCRFTLHAICPEAIENGWPTLVPSHWVCSRVKANTSHDSHSYNPTDTPIEERE